MRLLTLAVLFSFASAAVAEIRVPRVSGIVIDGSDADWNGTCARVDTMAAFGEPWSTDDFDARLRLGWDQRGLLLLVQVQDRIGTEAANISELWHADSMELYVADTLGGRERMQWTIAPGMDPRYPEPRIKPGDARSESLKKNKVELQLARGKTQGGYRLEMLIPWAAFSREVRLGDVVPLQVVVNSKDPQSPFRQILLYPLQGAWTSKMMVSLRLTEASASHAQATITAEYQRFSRVWAKVTAARELAGQKVLVVMTPEKQAAPSTQASPAAQAATDKQAVPDKQALPPAAQEVELTLGRDGRCTAEAVLPLPSYPVPQLVARVKDETTEPVVLPSLAQGRADAILRLPLIFQPAVFSGEDFPKAEFLNPERAEILLGRYTIKSSFYNAAMEPVTLAREPGRYGAVVEIRTADGQTLRRFRTLYRTPREAKLWEEHIPVKVQWPASVGMDPAILSQQAAAVDDAMRPLILDGIYDYGFGAQMLAGLSEMKPGEPEAGLMSNAESRDRAWWVKFKRRYYGLPPAARFDRPTLAKTPAPVLRPGTDEEAGFKPGTARKLDELMKRWAEESKEPFTVCVARNGVLILDGAYGNNGGKPMTRQTPSIVYSTSKILSGAAFMMAVDQGLLSLDDTPVKSLPAFRDYKGKAPTMAQLFTHTAGLDGHWGDEMNDLEEVLAEYLPHMQIGQFHRYNGVSLALGCKVLETISGEDILQYYQNHLLGPLGMENTQSTNASWRTWSTASDLAKLGQMLLNGGTYGDKLFFSRETFQQMLPHRLTRELSPEASVVWGIGLVWISDAAVFGHGSASGATFRVDPRSGLVITMARSAAGEKHAEFHKEFLDLISANMVQPK